MKTTQWFKYFWYSFSVISRWYLQEILLSLYIPLYIPLAYGTARVLLKVSKSYETILVMGDWTFSELFSYLIKLLTCLSDITLSISSKIGFNYFIAWVKLLTLDFLIKQKLILRMNTDVFLWVMFLGVISLPLKQPMLIFYFLQNGWILADVINPDRYFSIYIIFAIVIFKFYCVYVTFEIIHISKSDICFMFNRSNMRQSIQLKSPL